MTEDRWISVKERLPKRGTAIWQQWESGKVKRELNCSPEMDHYVNGEVLYWQPMESKPAPRKSEEKYERCEIYADKEGELSFCSNKSGKQCLSWAVDDPDFVGYEFEDGYVSSHSTVALDVTSGTIHGVGDIKSVMRAKYVVFERKS